ncbi:hypothetical protein EMCRGX_G001324 [Ephydatia muelleri]
MRLHTGRFIDTESPTFTLCGRDTIQYEVSVDNTRVEAVFRDTAGGERFRTLTKRYFRDNDAVILVYDVQSNFTLTALRGWIEEIEVNSNSTQFVWALFGNKCDLDPAGFEQGILDDYRLKLETNLSFFMSAKTGLNVKAGFESVVASLHRTAVSNWRRKSCLIGSDAQISFQTYNSESQTQCC